MSAISLEQAKCELAKDILSMTDINAVYRLRQSYNRITQPTEWPKAGPLSYEEMEERINLSTAQVDKGETVSLDDFILSLRKEIQGNER